jgi:hypothetical protein
MVIDFVLEVLLFLTVVAVIYNNCLRRPLHAASAVGGWHDASVCVVGTTRAVGYLMSLDKIYFKMLI